MSEFTPGKATICIVNYKTLDFTRLCLRSIRKFTTYPCDVVVVDNHSDDESLDYLRGLDWITLLERDTSGDDSGGRSHARALDLALEACTTEFFISMHSDTFVLREGWLSDLISHFDSPNVAGVGSGKIELTPRWREWVKMLTDYRTMKRKLLRTPDPLGKHRYYNRTICSLYRTEILKSEGMTFELGRDEGITAGKKMHFDLEDGGYDMVHIPEREMGKSIIHLAHATQVINPAEFSLRNKTTRKINGLIKKVMSMGPVQDVLHDDSLDQ
ncbi:MAG: glycosyltransferase family 2 protein [Phycisphaerales bacterium]|jgi:hypothetical protein|nr:glycosyltransferase family 2 protein [Phycisphaerales bacterium]MBT7170922.1 glycosyltransferase family 2 protein [Phycisphaerales bacterium]